MPLPYDPNDLDENDNGGWELKGGNYKWIIDSVEEKPSKRSGNQMLELILKVDVGGKYDATVFDHIVFKTQLWKMEQLCKATGVPFSPPPESFDFKNKTGEAKFKIEEYKGKKKLKVDYYHEKEDHSDNENGSPSWPEPVRKPADVTKDDIPF